MERMPSEPTRQFEPYQAAILAALTYFAVRLVFYATHLSPYVPPDEETHLGICRLFQQTYLVPADTPASYTYGLVTHTPYLYYWLMGRFLQLNLFGVSDLLFLRLVNVGIALATVLLGLQWIRQVTDNRITPVLFVVLLTNTPMYSVVGASVSYDNLTIAWAVLALCGLQRFKRQPGVPGVLMLASVLLAGTLTKQAYLPLAAIFGILGLYHGVQAARGGRLTAGSARANLGTGAFLWLGLAVGLLALNLGLYGYNLYHYGRPVPAADQVLTVEQAMHNRIYARNRIVGLYREGRRSYDEAVAMSAAIRHRGDRRATIYLLDLARQQASQPRALMNRGQYAVFWWHTMVQGLVGIIGHRTMLKPPAWVAAYHVLFLTALVILIGTWRRHQPAAALAEAGIVFGFYALILMWVLNYPVYRQFYSPVLALQGRYLLPVIVPFYGLVACAFGELLRGRFRIVPAVGLASFFIWGDFIYFLQHVDASWYALKLP